MPDGPATLDHLPDDPALLKGLVRELLITHRAQQRQIEQLTHRLDLHLKRVYGPRADRLDSSQLSLFDELPTEGSPAFVPPPEPEVITTTVKKNGHGPGKLPDDLRREPEIIDVLESVKQASGGQWQMIGEEISEKLDYTARGSRSRSAAKTLMTVCQALARTFIPRFDGKKKIHSP